METLLCGTRRAERVRSPPASAKLSRAVGPSRGLDGRRVRRAHHGRRDSPAPTLSLPRSLLGGWSTCGRRARWPPVATCGIEEGNLGCLVCVALFGWGGASVVSLYVRREPGYREGTARRSEISGFFAHERALLLLIDGELPLSLRNPLDYLGAAQRQLLVFIGSHGIAEAHALDNRQDSGAHAAACG